MSGITLISPFPLSPNKMNPQSKRNQKGREVDEHVPSAPCVPGPVLALHMQYLLNHSRDGCCHCSHATDRKMAWCWGAFFFYFPHASCLPNPSSLPRNVPQINNSALFVSTTSMEVLPPTPSWIVSIDQLLNQLSHQLSGFFVHPEAYVSPHRPHPAAR